MIEIKNKKIAIVGTSPIMLLLYFRLREENSVDVFENSNIGGAWRIDEINGQNYTTHNNVIVALNKDEEKFIDKINNELENLGCTKIKPTGKYETLSSYTHKNIYIHDLSGLYAEFKKQCISLIKKKVNNIKKSNDKIYLNGMEYDQVYLPSCFDIDQIILDKNSINTLSSKSISHHLTIVYEKIDVPNISYTENFDNVFDRAYFKQEGKNTLFTGRVRRKYKKLSSYQLVDVSNLLKDTTNNIIKLKLNKYHHTVIEENILKDLKSKLHKTNINIIETRQFVRSYKLLNSLIK
tara:strand:- start:303 stop:1184 length:882 start_codon:yes stop_codon:yes gene_type:complete